MKVEVKHYAKIILASTKEDQNILIAVPKREPSLIKEHPTIIGFRFFDQLETRYKGNILKSEPKNFSQGYYFGIPLSLEEMINCYNNYRFVKRVVFNKKQVGAVIHSSGVCYPLLEGDIVYREENMPLNEKRKRII